MPVNGVTMITGTNNVPVTANTIALQPGDIAGVADCGSADIFRVTNATTPTVALEHAAGANVEWLNSGAALSHGYQTVTVGTSVTTSVIGAYNAVRYYIGRGAGADTIAGNADDTPSLFRRTYDRTVPGYTNTELVDGVQDFQITYGVDTVGDGLPNAYIDGNATSGTVDLTTVAGWQNVMSVRIGLMFISPSETASEFDLNTYNVNGTAFDPIDDRRRRRVFTSTVQVRNL